MSLIPSSVPRDRAIFLEAVKIADEQARGEFLDRVCGGDAERRRKLELLLSARETEAVNSLDRAIEQLVPGESVGESHSARGDRNSPELPELGRVGKFRLERLVGSGGMGNVFLAYDEQLHRPAALKFPRVDVMGNSEQIERFLREARLAAQLNHPNLVEIYEVGVWGQACFIASQWCEGGDLSNWLIEHPGPQQPIWCALLLRSVARATAYCHQQGVVHLDIKPANIVLVADADSGGELPFKPMLTDFGIARVIEEGMTCTHSSLLLGTPLYMAPEQAESRRDQIGPASDVFALGVVLYELLYGRRPFEGDSAIEVLDQLRSPDSLVLPVTRKVPRELRTVCQRCLQHDPASRYPSADALALDLDRYLRGEPIRARPVSRLHHLWRWFERPERIVQAGVTAIVIQLIMLGEYVLILATKALGWPSPIEGEFSVLLVEPLLHMSLFHVPGVVLAWMALRRRRWAVPAGLFMTLIAVVAVGRVLVTGESPIPLYDGQPLATFLQHLMVLCALGITTFAYIAALPAAFCRTSYTRT